MARTKQTVRRPQAATTSSGALGVQKPVARRPSTVRTLKATRDELALNKETAAAARKFAQKFDADKFARRVTPMASIRFKSASASASGSAARPITDSTTSFTDEVDKEVEEILQADKTHKSHRAFSDVAGDFMFGIKLDRDELQKAIGASVEKELARIQKCTNWDVVHTRGDLAESVKEWKATQAFPDLPAADREFLENVQREDLEGRDLDELIREAAEQSDAEPEDDSEDSED